MQVVEAAGGDSFKPRPQIFYERLSMSEKKTLTPDQIQAYIDSRGATCPFCGASDLEGGPVQIDGGTAWQSVTCPECGGCWDDLYALTGIEPGKYGEWELTGIKEVPPANLDQTHPELADGVSLNAMVTLLKRCSYALDMIPNKKLPDGTRSYDIAAELSRMLPRDRRKD